MEKNQAREVYLERKTSLMKKNLCGAILIAKLLEYGCIINDTTFNP